MPVYSKDIASLINKYCFNCHDSAVAEGGIVLDAFLDGPPTKEHRSLLRLIDDNLRSESMPPEGEPRPDPLELDLLYAWLDHGLGTDDRQTGRTTTLRRLNRSEYNNTIRDLIGLDLRPADEFPADDIGYGFDNIGRSARHTSDPGEMYLAAADTVIGEAFRTVEVKERIPQPCRRSIPNRVSEVQAAGTHSPG